MSAGLMSGEPVPILPMPQVVPADFMGLHFRSWPIFDPSLWAGTSQPYPAVAAPAPTIPFGSVRLVDTGFSYWYQIETSAGVYNWSSLDTIITTHRAAGRTVIFCVYGTPTFYASAGDQAYKDYYNRYGGAAYPASTSPNGLTALGNFVTALITRYNTSGGGWGSQANGGGTNFSVLGKGIQVLEPWNEPQFGDVGPHNGFFWGTAPQMVDMMYTERTAAKAVDASIIVTGPGNYTVDNLQSELAANGAINTGVNGASLMDAVLYHCYSMTPKGMSFGAWTTDFQDSSNQGFLQTLAAMKVAGIGSLPIWMGEGGFDANYPTDTLLTAMAAPPSFRYTWLTRQILMAAALGCKKYMLYAWDTPYGCYPSNDPQGSQKAIEDVHNNVSGKTITSANYVGGGPVTLKFSDSSTFSA